MSKGDRVEVIVDVGGAARSFFVEAEANGRRVEVHEGQRGERGMVLVELQARTGKVIKTDRFMGSRVIAMIETKVEEPEEEAQTARARAVPEPQQEGLAFDG
jgi:hypothetical protein